MKLPGASGARVERAALPDVPRRRDRRRRTGRPTGHHRGRWLLALAAALPFFASGQILTGPSPWEIASRIWGFGLGFVATVLLAWGAWRMIRRAPALLLLALAPTAHAGGLGSIAPMGPGTWLVLLYVAAWVAVALLALGVVVAVTVGLLAIAQDAIGAWVRRDQ